MHFEVDLASINYPKITKIVRKEFQPKGRWVQVVLFVLFVVLFVIFLQNNERGFLYFPFDIILSLVTIIIGIVFFWVVFKREKSMHNSISNADFRQGISRIDLDEVGYTVENDWLYSRVKWLGVADAFDGKNHGVMIRVSDVEVVVIPAGKFDTPEAQADCVSQINTWITAAKA